MVEGVMCGRGRTASLPTLSCAALLAASIGLSACGASAHTTPHFVAVANAICIDATQQLDALAKPSTSLTALATSAAAEVPIVSAEVNQLATLTPPPAERPEFAAALSATRRQIAVIKLLIGAVRADNRARIISLALQARTVDAAAKAATTRLGLTKCAQSAQPAGSSP
jgi:hypothetical protein